MPPKSRRTLAAVAAGLILLLSTRTARAGSVLTVDIVTDELDSGCVPGDCSLREALADAVANDTIVFSLPGSPPWTIRLVTALGPLVVNEVVEIDGPGMTSLILSGDSNADGTGDLRVMRIDAGGVALIRDLTIRDGRLPTSTDRDGGCLRNNADVALLAVRFENCRAWEAPNPSCTGSRGGEGGAIVNLVGSAVAADSCEFVNNRAGRGAQDIASCSVGQPGGRGGAIANFGSAVVRRSTFTGNRGGDGAQGATSGVGGDGGAIASLAPGVLWIEESTFTDNRSGDGGVFMAAIGADGRGGALHLETNAALNNSTLHANLTGSVVGGGAAGGGGLFVQAGTTRLRNVTLTGNTARAAGGGIARAGGTLRLRNSIVAENLSVNTANEDCNTTAAASLVSEGFNVVGVNNGCAASFIGTDQVGTSGTPLLPGLDPIGSNGGPTPTRAVQETSVALDAGDPADCLAWDPNLAIDIPMPTDQRGEDRHVDGDGDTVALCDAGAYERALAPPVQHLLTVALAGSGTGSVASSPPGIACPSDCTESYLATETVTLTPTADPGSVFTGWSGDCTGSGGCSVPMTDDRDVTATFALLYTLDVTVTGGGTVTSTPGGISCPPDCTEEYADGTSVQLASTPNAGFQFTGWSGACTGTGACTLAMTQDRSVTATFVALRTLTVTVVGGGSVASTPGGISCPADCTEEYLDGTDVQLTATANAGFQFTGWSGACTGTGVCNLDMTQNRSVTATFVALRTLTVTVVGGGSVASTPGGISCPTDCTEEYLDGTDVQLAATPDPGFQFTGWSGACVGTGACNLDMTQNRSVTATFVALRTLTVSVAGGGLVVSEPGGIACPTTCTAVYLDGTDVQLTATPSGESYFVGWSGACSGTGVCNLDMTQNLSATATFDTLPFLDGFESGDTSRWSETEP